jgi:hypothetical protein
MRLKGLIRRLRRNNDTTHIPGIGPDHSCHTDRVWPIPGIFVQAGIVIFSKWPK